MPQNFALKKAGTLLSKWAGIIALLISSAVGVFTVIDQTLTAPDERRSADLAQLSAIITEIGKANISSVMHKGSPSQLAVAQGINSVKFPLLASAVGIVKKYPEHIDAASLIVLAQELIQVQDYGLALEYATMARNKDTVRDLRIVATQVMAGANMKMSGKSHSKEARRLFEETIAEAKRVKSVNRSWLISNTLRDWAIEEILLGNCEKAGRILARFKTDIPFPTGRAAAQAGFFSVVEAAHSIQTCAKEEFKVNFKSFSEILYPVFQLRDAPHGAGSPFEKQHYRQRQP